MVILRDPENPIVDKIAGSLEFKESIDGLATAHICSAGSCKKPTTDVNEMLRLLNVELK